ncbi:SRPBCC family protein [Sphingobium sp. AN641]|uniref:SRPBCC family protein n=1 Tax=Sphingobium sp. AN641 TaxID=3133443 RepID=UPI0030C0C99D
MNESNLELSVTRHIAAPPDIVWQVWTERTADWFCPRPWTVTIDEMDLRPGGRSALTMHGPGGEHFPNEGVFLEVVPGRRIVSTDAYAAGWVPQKPFMTSITTFEPEDGGTRYTAAARHWDADSMKAHADMGFAEGWGKVADQLAALCEEAVAKA